MTDYIELQEKKIPYEESGKLFELDRLFVRRTIDYCRFLKQPLTLGMFVPVDQCSKVIKWMPYFDFERSKVTIQDSLQKYDEYHDAKQRVLFVGCTVLKVRDYYVVYHNSQSIWISWTNRVIEDLIKHDIELTETAKKLLGYER